MNDMMPAGLLRSIREQGDHFEPELEEIPTRAAATLRPDVTELATFRTRRELARRYLPFLKTMTDFDITSEIGFHELTGPPLTVKQLILLDLAPSMTVFRRLERLCNLGVISRTRSPSDGRVNELRLAPAVHHLFAMYTNRFSQEQSAAKRIGATPQATPQRRAQFASAGV